VRKWANYENYKDEYGKYVWQFHNYIDTLILVDLDSSIMKYAIFQLELDTSDEDLFLKSETTMKWSGLNTYGIIGIWSEGGWDTLGASSPARV